MVPGAVSCGLWAVCCIHSASIVKNRTFSERLRGHRRFRTCRDAGEARVEQHDRSKNFRSIRSHH